MGSNSFKSYLVKIQANPDLISRSGRVVRDFTSFRSHLSQRWDSRLRKILTAPSSLPPLAIGRGSNSKSGNFKERKKELCAWEIFQAYQTPWLCSDRLSINLTNFYFLIIWKSHLVNSFRYIIRKGNSHIYILHAHRFLG